MPSELEEVWKCSDGFKISGLILEGSNGHIPASRKDCLTRNGEQTWSKGSLNNRGKSHLATTKSCRAKVRDFSAVPNVALSGLKMFLSGGCVTCVV